MIQVCLNKSSFKLSFTLQHYSSYYDCVGGVINMNGVEVWKVWGPDSRDDIHISLKHVASLLLTCLSIKEKLKLYFLLKSLTFHLNQAEILKYDA